MSSATEQPRPQVDDIEKSIDSFLGRMGRSWKKIAIFAALFLVVWFVLAPNFAGWWQYISVGLLLLMQLLFAILFMIVQFAALFWFLGRPRIYWILAGAA